MKPRTILLAFFAGAALASCAALSGNRLPAAAVAPLSAAPNTQLTPTQDRATGLYGYLNDFGIWSIRPIYKMAWGFNDAGIACVRTQSGYGAINKFNQFVAKPVFADWSSISAAVRSLSSGRLPGVDLWFQRDPATGLCGFLDYRGEWFIAPQYTGGYDFDDNGCAVVEASRGKWGAIDRRNQFVIQPNFTSSVDARAALRRITQR